MKLVETQFLEELVDNGLNNKLSTPEQMYPAFESKDTRTQTKNDNRIIHLLGYGITPPPNPNGFI